MLPRRLQPRRLLQSTSGLPADVWVADVWAADVWVADVWAADVYVAEPNLTLTLTLLFLAIYKKNRNQVC